MCSFSEQNICLHCDYKTEKKYNLSRHMVTKHHLQKHTLSLQKHTLSLQKHTLLLQKDTLPLQKDTHNTVRDNKTCTTCEKTFCSKYRLSTHIPICKKKEYNYYFCS